MEVKVLSIHNSLFIFTGLSSHKIAVTFDLMLSMNTDSLEIALQTLDRLLCGLCLSAEFTFRSPNLHLSLSIKNGMSNNFSLMLF